MSEYNPTLIEKEWQKIWELEKSFHQTWIPKKKILRFRNVPLSVGEYSHGTSQELHYWRCNSKVLQIKKFNVLHPMGWDSFGMPAENAAIENNISPKVWTEQNIKNMRKQLKSIGLSIDWSREISTCSENYYKHQQKIFIDLFNNGFVYKKR